MILALGWQVSTAHAQSTECAVSPSFRRGELRVGTSRLPVPSLRGRMRIQTLGHDRQTCTIALSPRRARTPELHLFAWWGGQLHPLGRYAARFEPMLGEQFAPRNELRAPLEEARITHVTRNHAATELWLQGVESVAQACSRAQAGYAKRRWWTARWSPTMGMVTEDYEPANVPIAVACGDPPTSAPAPAASRPPTARPFDDAAERLASNRVQVRDGAADVPIEVWSDGRLRVQGRSAPLDLGPLVAPPATAPNLGSLRMWSTCGAGDRRWIWIRYNGHEVDESISWRTQIFAMRRGRLVRIFVQERSSEGWMSHEPLGLRARCDGTLEDLHIDPSLHAAVPTTMGRAPGWGRMVRDVYAVHGGELAPDRRELLPWYFDLGAFAACPMLYVQAAGAFVAHGEILRNLVDANGYGTDTRELGSRGGELVIEIREEKQEVTHLDAIHVEVDGRVYAPVSCQQGDPAFCVPDHRSHVLRRGDVVRLRFHLPAGPARLIATGHYDRIR